MENWCCRRCQFCHVCGLQTGLLQCDRCQVRDDGDDDDNGKMHCGDRVLLSLSVLPRLWSADVVRYVIMGLLMVMVMIMERCIVEIGCCCHC